ncbi:TPA: hypothetical protein ACIVI2_003031, partial [Salmonella enterica subsp. enterica serovar Potsdam]
MEYILIDTIKSILPFALIILFAITPLGRKITSSFINTFLDKGIKEPEKITINDDVTAPPKNSEIIELIREEIVKISEDQNENIKIAKEKINHEVNNQISSYLDDKNKNINCIVSERIEREVSAIADKYLENSETFAKINDQYRLNQKRRNNENLMRHLDSEYYSSQRTKQLMSNLFIMINFIYFTGLLFFFMKTMILTSTEITDSQIPTKLAISISLAYLGFGAFIIYMIKFCNARTLTILSLKEDISKKDDVIDIVKDMISKDISENHVAILKLINSNYSMR